MIVADTDVLIDYLQGRDPAASRVALALERAELHTTAITRFELLAGARDARQVTTIRQLLDAVPTLALDQPAANRAAEVRRRLERAGQGIGMADSLIAGIVLIAHATLLTRNRRHFERVADLRLGRLA